MEEIGARNSDQAAIFDQLMDSKPLYLTNNTYTMYVLSALDLKRDNATVN
jgi:hypothetical protein